MAIFSNLRRLELINAGMLLPPSAHRVLHASHSDVVIERVVIGRSKRTGACDRGHFIACCDPQQRTGWIYSYTIKTFRAVPQGACSQYLRIPRTSSAQSGRTLVGTGALYAFFRFTPLTRNAAPGAEPGIEPAGGHSRGRMLPRLGGSRPPAARRRHDDRAHRVPRSDMMGGILLYGSPRAARAASTAPAAAVVGGFGRRARESVGPT